MPPLAPVAPSTAETAETGGGAGAAFSWSMSVFTSSSDMDKHVCIYYNFAESSRNDFLLLFGSSPFFTESVSCCLE
jgi:hypothetical protein